MAMAFYIKSDRNSYPGSLPSVIPVQTGIHPDALHDRDRLRGNDKSLGTSHITLKFLYILACGLLIGLQGCSSTKDSSDIPWNVPQPWEGTPTIPGGNQ